MKLGKSIWQTPGWSTKAALFSPTGDLLVNSNEVWRSYHPTHQASRDLSLKGTPAFFGKWLASYDSTRDESITIAWPDGAPQACDLGFDLSNNQDTPLVATAEKLVAIVRKGHLWIRPGTPDSVEDALNWTQVMDDGFFSNLRLLCTWDGRFVIGTNLGTSIDVYDVLEKRRFTIELSGQGHPNWATVHPSQHVVAVFSRALDVIDLKSECARFVMQLPEPSGGEFLPDGTLLFSSQLGLLSVDEAMRLRHAAAFEYHDINRPLRLFPDGKHVLLGRDQQLTVHPIKL
jgi:hypothetical protein